MDAKTLVTTALTALAEDDDPTPAVERFYSPDFVQHSPMLPAGRDSLVPAFTTVRYKPVPPGTSPDGLNSYVMFLSRNTGVPTVAESFNFGTILMTFASSVVSVLIPAPVQFARVPAEIVLPPMT